jgi:hypothetical protein
MADGSFEMIALDLLIFEIRARSRGGKLHEMREPSGALPGNPSLCTNIALRVVSRSGFREIMYS